MKIFVTGATGFVGAACADALERAGHDVVRGSRRPPLETKPNQHWAIYGDLNEAVDWMPLLTGCNGVLHCAGLASVSDDVTDEAAYAINVAATGRLAEAAAAAGIKRFVYMSSALAASNDDRNRYASTKRTAEEHVSGIAKTRGMDWVILRPPMIYGPNNRGNFARLVRLVESGMPLPLGAATAPKSFLAIDNLTSAVVRVFEHRQALNQVFVVADSELTSTAELVRNIASALGRPARLLAVPAAAMRAAGSLTGKSSEIKSLFESAVASTANIREVLSWSPPVAQKDAIRAAVLRQADAPAKIAFLVTEDWFLCSHFLPLIRAARQLGLDVVAVTRIRNHRALLEAEGARVIALEADRSSANPFGLLRGAWQLRSILRREAPDIVHAIALRMVLIGGIAARSAGIKNIVLAPTGLGHLWASKGAVQSVARTAIRMAVRHALNRPGTVFFFENRDDPADLGLDAASANVVIVPGAGVDPATFQPSPEPLAPPVKIAVVARMTKAKGIWDSAAAVREARARGAAVELHLFGGVDAGNLGALTETELRALSAEPGIRWHGASADIPAVWRAHHIAMLLTSYREGIPRSLIEAAACGRPMIATDVIGCRDIVRDGKDGILVAEGDTSAAADAIVRLANDASARQAFGRSAHERFLSEFTEAIVRARVAGVYRRMLSQKD